MKIMNIRFYNEDVNYNLVSKRKIRLWLSQVMMQEQKNGGEISCIFCSDDYLLTLNNQYLNASYLTDVITFDYTENELVSGDIFISIDRVKENAKLYKQICFQEMLRVILHGVLHLCGYKDKTEKEIQKMREKEDYYLQKFTAIN
jgi:rRNA maturation RNase YbeY